MSDPYDESMKRNLARVTEPPEVTVAQETFSVDGYLPIRGGTALWR